MKKVIKINFSCMYLKLAHTIMYPDSVLSKKQRKGKIRISTIKCFNERISSIWGQKTAIIYR